MFSALFGMSKFTYFLNKLTDSWIEVIALCLCTQAANVGIHQVEINKVGVVHHAFISLIS